MKTGNQSFEINGSYYTKKKTKVTADRAGETHCLSPCNKIAHDLKRIWTCFHERGNTASYQIK